MAGQFKHVKQFLQVAALGLFIIQMNLAMQNFFAHPSMTAGETREILSLDSPILVTVCKLDQIDLKALRKIGYKSEMYYFWGKTDGSSSSISWTGNGTAGNLTQEAILNQIYRSGAHNVRPRRGIKRGGSRTLLPHGHCTHFEDLPSNILQNPGSWENAFSVFINDSDGKYQIFVSDPRAAPTFQLPHPLMTGDKIIALPTMINTIHYYSIVLTEIRTELDDDSCTNYPDTAGHGSFTECVEAENKRMILPVLGCMPPWLSQSAACTGHVMKNDNDNLSEWFKALYQRSKMGSFYQSPSCLPSCKHFTVHAVLHHVKTGSGQTEDANKINLFFEKVVQVERIIPAYGIGSLLVEVGSSLGLWLGLSVVGIFDVVVSSYHRIMNLMCNRNM